ncbi:hypothetical protein [Papillibacter cinnamivorans]|uniref:Flagellar operon protein TIGR03826 n=1 Tax=Papillibacter cinnamivorans DSM 12816 TaxID=1122930 RepID=A0A1W1YH66_9FIRM|nr:hypothetical protein [Papillibacter cinnamivorans]SMC35515.1 hypothetical protein SAMN02745168_0411 [Papillibacter cinnamivorans DSM 12816]
MSGYTVKTCEYCGRLFQSIGTDICSACSEKLDRDFVKVREYIYENPENVSIADILENTEVPEKVIRLFLKEGRISSRTVSLGDYVKCEACGAPTDGGRLCRKCAAAFSAEAAKLSSQVKENPKEDPARRAWNSRSMHTYQKD